jgi:ABC-type polysaccharide/polyol phosphate transport system ATPase subunit
MAPIVRCSHLTKNFRWRDRNLSLKRSFTAAFKGRRTDQDREVLSDLSFEMEPGERLAIIGRNGCGKTTLLRLIAGIYRPSSGLVEVHARRALALLELGVGFYPDLTGRENIRLNWVFNGLRKQELERRFDSIVEFSGVARSLETPLKFYSSGMRARLGFSIAVHADPDLLIVDEVLAVGDAEFQARCHERINGLCSGGTTLMLVSHNPADITRTCTRGIWLQNGTAAFDGPPQEALRHYAGAAG